MAIPDGMAIYHRPVSPLEGCTGREGWLGCKDSNLDNQIQNLESCHWTTSQRAQKVKNLYGTGQRSGSYNRQ